MELRITADAPALTLQFLRCGAETVSTERNDELAGAPKGDPVPIDWTGKRSGPVTITVQTGGWPPGVYAARLTTDDGRIGLRALRPSRRRDGAAQAADRDADEHLAGVQLLRRRRRRLGRHVVRRRQPARRPQPPLPRSRRAATVQDLRPRRSSAGSHAPERRRISRRTTTSRPFATGDELRARYDLVVFPGHSEYMTAHAYDVVERYRDLGGRLVFLSANNFFWKVESDGSTLRRVKLWRDLRPSGGAPLSACSTGPTTTARRQGAVHGRRSRGRARGSSTRPASSTARRSARRSAATGSRSTWRRPIRRPGRSCSRGSSTSSGPG